MAHAVEAKGSLRDGPRAARRPIDMMHLAKQSLGDANLEVELMRLFSEAASVYFGRLETATTVPDLLHHLHVLKGASVGIGAWSLAEHVHVMASELKAGKPVNPEHIEDIHLSVAEVQAFISERVAEADAADEAELARN